MAGSVNVFSTFSNIYGQVIYLEKEGVTLAKVSRVSKVFCKTPAEIANVAGSQNTSGELCLNKYFNKRMLHTKTHIISSFFFKQFIFFSLMNKKDILIQLFKSINKTQMT